MDLRRCNTSKWRIQDFLPFFEAVFTSDALGYKKPRKEAFERSLELANSEATQAIMIGDDLECDVHGARLAGWRQVHYGRNGCTHGARNLATGQGLEGIA